MKCSWKPAVLGLVLACASVSGFSSQAADGDQRPLLTIGSTAPALDIEHWVSDGKGAFMPVKKFEAGKVYVVEFWATWCGPCIATMPHLAKLQKDYVARGVQIISISDEELEVVQEFLKKPVPPSSAPGAPKSEKSQTFGELTSVYSLTTDPDGSSSETYMQAARQSGIPTSFVVGKTGQIEWIGHPAEIDEPLSQIVAGKWDREKFGEAFKAEQEAAIAMEALREALAARKFDDAVKLIDQQVGKVRDPQMKFQLQMTKMQVLLVQGKVEEASKHLQACYADAAQDIGMVDAISWHIFEQSEQRQGDLKPLLKVARDRAAKALAIAMGEARGSLLDTVSHLTWKLGELDEAIVLAKQAVAGSSDQNKQFSQQFLDQLLAEKEAAQKPASDKPAAEKGKPAPK